VTGHFEDKTIVAYRRSEAAIARLFIRVQYRVRKDLIAALGPSGFFDDTADGETARELR
jgi:hypothetical protein